MMKYAVVFEGDDATGYSAYVLDLPGVIARGKTLDKTRERMRSAIDFHPRCLRADGDPIPQPACVVEMIEAT
jgi:predicted RNase H-like HicB family nuclease